MEQSKALALGPRLIARISLKCLQKHWYNEVLYKRFLTPFRDDIWNRRQVSVGDRGVLPTRPRNRRGYALLAHMLGKMRSCATKYGYTYNSAKKYNYTGKIIFGRKYIPHSQAL